MDPVLHKEDENQQRGNWSGKLDFMLSSIGYAVGLGNIVRFPYLCYRNGGAPFLIPYVIMFVLCGLPLFLFELVIGQFSSRGAVTVWSMCPIFKGIGWAMLSINAMFAIYNNVVISYAIYYMVISVMNLANDVPWISCDNYWNTDRCRAMYPDFTQLKSNETARIEAAKGILDMDCVRKDSTFLGMSLEDIGNDSDVLLSFRSNCSLALASPTAEFWERRILMVHESQGIGDVTEVVWNIFACNAVAAFVVFLCVMKGIKSSGKVVYFTATFPYVMLTILLLRGATLPGSLNGVMFYIVPTAESWEKLKDVEVWRAAATQIFYSLGPAWGALITMASYNKFKNNCYRDAVIVACINSSTSIYGGFAIFTMLGFMAHATNQDINEIATYGPGLAFIAYPAGIAQLPGSAIWGFLFFFMLVLLGLDTQFVTVETIITGIQDTFPRLRARKTLVALGVCFALFLFAFPQFTKAGIHVLTLMDWYTASYGLLIIALAEIISAFWFYGVGNIAKDFEMMIGYKPHRYWLITWPIVAPICMTFIIVMAGINDSKAYYGKYVYEDWAQGLGWLIVVTPMICIMCGAAAQVLRPVLSRKQGFLESLKAATRHTDDWGPALNKHRALDPKRYRALEQNGAAMVDTAEGPMLPGPNSDADSSV